MPVQHLDQPGGAGTRLPTTVLWPVRWGPVPAVEGSTCPWHTAAGGRLQLPTLQQPDQLLALQVTDRMPMRRPGQEPPGEQGAQHGDGACSHLKPCGIGQLLLSTSE